MVVVIRNVNIQKMSDSESDYNIIIKEKKLLWRVAELLKRIQMLINTSELCKGQFSPDYSVTAS